MFQNVVLPSISPATFLSVAEFFADWKGTCLLYSGGHLDSAQCSLLGLFPFETITVYGKQLDYRKGTLCKKVAATNPWEGLQSNFFAPLAKNKDALAFGWFGYGMGAFADQDLLLPYRPSFVPDAYWQRCAVVLKLDHKTGNTFIQIELSALDEVEAKAKDWIKCFATLKGWQEFLCSLPKKLIRYVPIGAHPALDTSQRQATYVNKVLQAQDLIRAGEIYQVNLSQQFAFQSSRHSFSLFHQMCLLNPAPFSAYFCHEHMTIICTSPERFLCKKGSLLETRPIKGTMPRGKTIEEDQRLQSRLLHSPKERAELLMITDLMRNDLGKVSKVGSVQTLELWRCEAYANVFQLYSLIRSLVPPDLAPLEIIRACFPGGSITGCPKLRAMEVIDALEDRARGIYTGSIGYITSQGDFDLNIVIRTLVNSAGHFSLQLGGGIVIDSDPYQEYQETLIKGSSLFQSLQSQEMRME